MEEKIEPIVARFVKWVLRGDGPSPEGRVMFQIESPEEFGALEHGVLTMQFSDEQLREALLDGNKRRELCAQMKNNPHREKKHHPSWHVPLDRDAEGRLIERSREEEREP